MKRTKLATYIVCTPINYPKILGVPYTEDGWLYAKVLAFIPDKNYTREDLSFCSTRSDPCIQSTYNKPETKKYYTKDIPEECLVYLL